MKSLPIGLTLLVTLALIGGCNKTAPPEPATKEAPSEHPNPNIVELSEDAKKLAGIQTEAAKITPIQTLLEVPGTVSIPSDARAVVTPPVAGKVLRLMASVGDRVTRGAALVTIQSADLAAADSAIAAAQAGAAQAESAVRQQASAIELARGRVRTAEANLARQRRFASAGAFSQPSLTTARSEVNEAQTEGAAARSELAGAKSRLDRAERLSREGLVARADLDQARLDVEQAQIRVDRSAQRLSLAQEILRRESRIVEQGLSNSREIQVAEAEARAAQLELNSARVALEGTRSSLASARRGIANASANAAALRGGAAGSGSTITLVAPIAGVVVERRATLGQAVERSSDLFGIEDAAVVWVTANVPEASVARIRPGAAVSVVTDAYPGRNFPGVVRLIGDRLDAKTRTLPVQCRIVNTNRLLRSDLFARVSITTGQVAAALAVPRSALFGADDDPSVFIAIGGKFERRKVKTGRADATRVEILEGVKASDLVVTGGTFILQSELRKGELKEEG